MHISNKILLSFDPVEDAEPLYKLQEFVKENHKKVKLRLESMSTTEVVYSCSSSYKIDNPNQAVESIIGDFDLREED